MPRKLRKRALRIGIGAVLFIIAMVVPLTGYWRLALFVPAYLVIGGDVLLRAGKNIVHGKVFDENFLMCIATVGAFLVGEYPEAVTVMLFYQVGELFQAYAVDKSRKSIKSLMDIRPDAATVRRGGEWVTVSPEEVAVGDQILVKPGERIPLDGVVEEGNSLADTSALTGESVPREINPGDEVLSGCVNMNGAVTVRVAKEYGESTVAKILEMVENAGSRKAAAENFITKFARVYTPAVVVVALLLAFLPPLLLPGATLADWGYRALVFLVVSCPCALVISIPLGFFGGIGGASKCGILVKGSNYLEALARTEIVAFDKTGTLTRGSFQVSQVQPRGMAAAELIELAALAECFSSHPISRSLKEAYGRPVEEARLAEVEEIPGHGVKALVDGKRVLAGNGRLMEREGIPFPEQRIPGTVVHVALEGQYAGFIVIADEVKPDAAAALSQLKELGVRETVMLTGDSRAVGEQVAQNLGIDRVYAELLPGDKVERMEELLAQKHPKGVLAYVGDGMNDAPVLARADIGIAMGALGSDAAIEAADVVIMTDEPSRIPTALRIAKRTLTIVRQNIVFALVVKLAVLALGALGIANMWEAVFADVGVSVLAILNAMRMLRVKQYR